MDSYLKESIDLTLIQLKQDELLDLIKLIIISHLDSYNITKLKLWLNAEEVNIPKPF